MDALARFALKPLAASLAVLTLAACSHFQADPPGAGQLPEYQSPAPTGAC